MSGAIDHKQVLELAEVAFQQCTNLPFAVYLVSLDGTFLQHNKACQTLFHLPDTPSYQDNVLDYYIHSSDRKENLKRLRKTGDAPFSLTCEVRVPFAR